MAPKDCAARQGADELTKLIDDGQLKIGENKGWPVANRTRFKLPLSEAMIMKHATLSGTPTGQ